MIPEQPDEHYRRKNDCSKCPCFKCLEIESHAYFINSFDLFPCPGRFIHILIFYQHFFTGFIDLIFTDLFEKEK